MKFLTAPDYQPLCRQLFIFYQTKILQLLPDAKVEHIGSSAIPHAISKGDLDIYIEVESSQFEKAISLLTTLSFKEKQNTLRTPDLCMLESCNGDNVAFQLVRTGSKFQNFLTFRDQLCLSSSLLAQYNSLKQNCIGMHPSEYRQIKASFIEQVLNQK
ncbi:MAG: GrpB family protein [Acinetobacter sp.]